MKRAYCMVCTSVGIALGAHAQDYPVRPLRLIVTSAPVGTNDIVARLVAAKLTAGLGQQMIVDNRPGASGVIGAQLVAKAAPDGYTLLLGNFSTMAVNVSLQKSLPYDPLRDFQPITLLARVPQILVVHPSLPVRSVKDLIALARAKPGYLTYGSGTNGTGAHLSAALLKWLARIDLAQVPYKSGVGGALVELVAGQLTLVFGGVPGVAPYLKSGKLRALGVTGAQRVAVLPDLPTIAEAGVPGYEVTLWYGMLAPARTSAAIVSKLHGALLRAIQAPDMGERMAADGADPASNTPDEFRAYIRSEIGRWAAVMKASGIHAE